MAEKIPLYAEPDAGNPGQATIREMPVGDIPTGTYPKSVMGNHGVAATDGAGNALGVQVPPLNVVGRGESGNVGALDIDALKAILRVVSTSTGASTGVRMVQTGTTGKLSVTLLPDEVLQGQANQGDSISIGEEDPPPSGWAHVFKAVVGGIMQFRGVISNTPSRVAISETPNDVVVDVVVDDSGADSAALYSAGRIDALIAAVADSISDADLVSDETPELGGDLDLGGFAIMHDIGGANEIEVLSIETGGDAPILKLMGQAAVIAQLDDPQEGDRLAWDAVNGYFVNVAPTVIPQITAPDRFVARLAANYTLAAGVEEGAPFTDAAIEVSSDHLAPAANEGAGVNFERIAYAPEDEETRKYLVTFEVTLSSNAPATAGSVRAVIAKWQTGSGARGDLPGTVRHASAFPKASISVTAEVTLQDQTEIGLMLLHTQADGETVQLLADACNVRLEEIQGA